MVQRFGATIIGTGLLLLFVAPAISQPLPLEPGIIQSISGQFTIGASGGFSPLRHNAAVAANTNLIQLEPALLAVSAENLKKVLGRALGIKSDEAWRGKINFILYPAQSPDEGVTITSGLVLRNWNYRVELPDVLTQTRYVRSLTAVLLLEMANRSAAGHPAELPPWLVDGLAQHILATDSEKVILSTPTRTPEGLPSRLVKGRHGTDALAATRRTLKNFPALTFDQMCWPTDAQVDGADGGAYQASAQLFVASLLDLPAGRAGLRDFLARAPDCLNWQTAFLAAFPERFRTPLDVEKWWALRVLNFAAHDPGPRWNAATSRERLEQLLSVPVEFRANSNALPTQAEVTLQVALRNFTEAQLTGVLLLKQRDLELAQLRLAPPFGALAGGYRKALTDFLGQKITTPATTGTRNQPTAMRRRTSLEATLKQLDALDERRQDAAGKVRDSIRP